MVKVIYSKLKGFTIMESIVAMVILILCFGFASTLIVKVMASEDQVRKKKAFLLAKEITENVKTKKIYLDDTTEKDDFIIDTKINAYRSIPNLIQIIVVVKDSNGKVLCVVNQLSGK